MRANDLPEMDELFPVRFNVLSYSEIKIRPLRSVTGARCMSRRNRTNGCRPCVSGACRPWDRSAHGCTPSWCGNGAGRRLSTRRRIRCDGKMKFWLHFFVFRQKDSIFAHPFGVNSRKACPERWVSGLYHRFAKPACGVTRTTSSNLVLSAKWKPPIFLVVFSYPKGFLIVFQK